MITYKTSEEIEVMREGGRILASIMRESKKLAKPGVTTDEVDRFFSDEIHKAGCVPSFLNYTPYGAKRPFPASLCVSINHEIVHGIPTENPQTLKDGDIVTFDAGLIYKGMFLDHAWTFPVGKISKEAKALLRATEEGMYAGIKNAKAGKHIGDISHAIEARADKDGLFIVEGLSGHGVGYAIHEDPYVPNEGDPKTGELIKVGLVIAIEPMYAIGTHKIKLERDGYTYSTKDGSLAAQFEHTVAVTDKGPVILTK
jgi:methionyl aminopeptidase